MSPDGAVTTHKPALLAQLPLRLHHHAYVVRDQEANRHFFEDILGIPLVATWCERTRVQERDVAMCHTFFGLGDGGALAFFAFADPEVYQLLHGREAAEGRAISITSPSRSNRHLWRDHRRGSQPPASTYRENDHGYCKSVYATSPDGLIVEFTVDPPGVEQIDAMRRADAHSELARWIGGDHHTNNTIRPH